MWKITYTKKAAKQISKLPGLAREAMSALAQDIKEHGPVRGNWPNYGKLGCGQHHCHLASAVATQEATDEDSS